LGSLVRWEHSPTFAGVISASLINEKYAYAHEFKLSSSVEKQSILEIACQLVGVSRNLDGPLSQLWDP
jgi:hypothetical protein